MFNPDRPSPVDFKTSGQPEPSERIPGCSICGLPNCTEHRQEGREQGTEAGSTWEGFESREIQRAIWEELPERAEWETLDGSATWLPTSGITIERTSPLAKTTEQDTIVLSDPNATYLKSLSYGPERAIAIAAAFSITLGADMIFTVEEDGATFAYSDQGGGRLDNPTFGPDGTLVLSRSVSPEEPRQLLRVRTENNTSICERLLFNDCWHPSTGPDGTIVVLHGEDKLLRIKPDGTRSTLKHPALKELYTPSFGPDGTLVALTQNGQIVRIQEDGVVSLLKDPEGKRLHVPFMGGDGTLLVGREDSAILCIEQDGKTSVLSDSNEKAGGFNRPQLSPDGELIMTRGSNIVLHPRKEPKEREQETTTDIPAKRAF